MLKADDVVVIDHCGERPSVLGMTGKSSIGLVLLRMMELCGGKITIDGQDISQLGLKLLRKRIGIVPQDPALFRGTVRQNVDPGGEYADAEIWAVLDKACLKRRIQRMDGGLDADISENGSNLSAGERQLVCLSRALLRRARIIIMDEASSYVDQENDQRLQSSVREHLGDCTLLVIAHRLHTVVDCDAVVVIADGQVAEGPAPPAELLNNKNSMLSKLAHELGMDVAEELKTVAGRRV